jgi:hypothetical protein
VSPGAHALPHVPQLAGSSLTVVQIPEQFVVPVAHVVAHAPAEQTCPDVQALPQAPQLPGSLPRFTQRLPHLVVPPTH